MSSLSQIRKEIDELDEILALEVTDLVDLEDKLAMRNASVELYRKQKNKLVRALAILDGKDQEANIPTPVKVEPESRVVKAPPKKGGGRPKGSKNKPKLAPQAEARDKTSKADEPFIRKVRVVPPEMVCNSCSGEMISTLKKLPNGKVIPVKICEECSNEVYV